MTVMRWADARGLIGNTENGWNRHDCRRVWLVAAVHPEGALIFLTPPDEPNWEEIENPILAFDNAREAAVVASHQEQKVWYPINLYDLLSFEDGHTRPRYRVSEPFLDEVTRVWTKVRTGEIER